MDVATLDASRSRAILIVTSVFLGISLISVALRVFVRTRIVRAFGWDDSIMVLAMGLNLIFAICGIIGSKYGIGRQLAYFVLHPDYLHRALLCWWLGQIFYVLTCVVAKISIIIALLRITVDRIHAYILYAAMVLATVVGLVFFFFTIFQCSPVNFFWNQMQPGAEGSCVNKDTLIGIAYLYSVGAAVTDLTIGLLPVALIWNLRMNRRTKGAIAGILGIGCIASAAVIVRIPFVHHYKDQEFLYNTYQISIWSNVEAGLGITAGCLTTLRPLVRFLRDGSSSHSRTPRSFPLSGNVAGFHRSSRSHSKLASQHDANQLWTGSEHDDHGVTTTIMGSRRAKAHSSSEEDLNPSPWKVERSVRVSVRDS
ncbi:hypothetical protein N7499_004418 [Penicillium canescens]|uniref:Rhodopsin domain-containing protein n=1 Tax=Penicillium canescens TaxID=5083 RepID=A0AAD6IAJ9_PENCN|nr:uncharacterized protein N7446_005289 [Penicillium canescens]KAJ6010177.1 hypothetical protein N7522_005193 [Penicillium canescens]KAJ6038485.1 hypothetical protein N7460_008256 [Penicillium canescens]KAJ6039455.1 hypothetical protein N7444_008360 [Penicillium canescens]KAJ6068252.1 hypothetical protein N7446_005289 [Penicillium canescens]KAJ6084789.1 hypothetical protein N7499_004418 [Penicillium canescens]